MMSEILYKKVEKVQCGNIMKLLLVQSILSSTRKCSKGIENRVLARGRDPDQ